MTDKTLGACQCHEKHAPTYWKGVVREYKDALDKAEQERDEARANAYNWEATAEEWEKRAVRAESHPLTPDAITDEMVKRAKLKAGELGWFRRFDAPTEEWQAVLTAAFTEPPARPEGAEKVEAVLHQYWSGDINGDELANRIAEEMNR